MKLSEEKNVIRSEVLRLLKEDEEFRYAVVGLLGLEDLRVSMKKLAEEVTKLAEAQIKTEKRVSELAEAQERTEKRVRELAEAQERTEKRVSELAEAQERTEKRVSELAEAQTRMEKSINELAEAQIRTEKRVSELAMHVGRLAEVVGYSLEDIAKVVAPGWLYRHEGIEVEELERRFVIIDKEEIEINLYGEGVWKDEKVIVLGEVKSRIYTREVEEFDEKVAKVERILPGRKYKLLFGYLIHPSAEGEARRRGIKLIASYMR